jgi:ABC-2 type transport system permease protein
VSQRALSADRRTGRRTLVVAEREFRTVLRTPTFALLAGGFLAIVLGVAWIGSGGAGYVPLALDLLTPMEVLVPVLAFAFGYRAIIDEKRRGELDVLRTYPISRPAFVVGVYLGRAAALLTATVASLALAPVLVLASGSEMSVLATHGTADSFLLYARFLVLTAGYTLVLLAVGVAASAVVRTAREALAVAVALFLAVVVGFDVGIVGALAGELLGSGGLAPLLAASPASAYRGLVLELVLGAISPQSLGPAADPWLNAVGLALWFVAALFVAVRTVWSE